MVLTIHHACTLHHHKNFESHLTILLFNVQNIATGIFLSTVEMPSTNEINILAYESNMTYIKIMKNLHDLNALRILQAADEIRSRLAGEFSAVHGLSVNEYFLLAHLENAPLNRLSRTELAKRMHISASTITRMVAPMEKIGLLERVNDPRDARLSYVAPTKAARTRFAEARKTFTKHAEFMFQDRWNDEEMETLAALLYRLVSGTPANLT